MFSFVGDTVLDPFLGTGTTSLAAARWGRNSIGYEIDSEYYRFAANRLKESTSSLFNAATIECHNDSGESVRRSGSPECRIQNPIAVHHRHDQS